MATRRTAWPWCWSWPDPPTRTLLSTVWRGVQSDLELPAPAIAVSGIDAFLPIVVFARRARLHRPSGAHLEGLCLRYLSLVAPARLSIMPAVDAACPDKIHHTMLVPALQPATGRWSAFVAPDLAAIFSAEPWLDLPPSPEAQARILSPLECIKPAVFHAVLERMNPAVSTETSPMTSVTGERQGSQTKQRVKASAPHENSLDPKGFLLGVMGDKTVELHLRIEAAKALLPYFEGRGGG